MNASPNTKRVLCFGDSNTWGRSGKNPDRYPVSIRWTGILQQKLGTQYEVIEEGLRSRTTNLDDSDPQFPGRNGLEYLRPCLESHAYLDLVILWLGTNDLKTKFNRQPEDVREGVAQLISLIQLISTDALHQPTQMLLISPPLVREEVLKEESQFAGAGEKSKKLATQLQELAQQRGCLFLDIAQIARAGEFDGVHLEPESHQVVAEKIHEIVQSI